MAWVPWPTSPSVRVPACKCKVVTVAVVGNIGAGKSTFLPNLRDIIQDMHTWDVDLATEDIDKWAMIGSVNLLDAQYTNPAHNAVAFQLNMLTNRHRQQREMDAEMRAACVKTRTPGVECPRNVRIRITERTARCGEVFGNVMKNTGVLDPVHNAVLTEAIANMETVISPPSVVIHLYVPPVDCYARMCHRGRAAECGVKLDYLELVDAEYAELLKTCNNVITVRNELNAHKTREYGDVMNDVLKAIMRSYVACANT